MTGINGFLAIANGHPQFDGMKVVVDRPQGRGAPRAATATVWRKDRSHPHEVTVYFEEYYRPGFNGKQSNWDKMPCTMLEKVAKARALREAFPQELGGINTEDEMPADFALQLEPEPERAPEPPKQLEGAQVRYEIKQPTRDQELYLEKHGAYRDSDGSWIAPADLGPKLDKYKVGGSPKAEPKAETDSDNDWRKEADALPGLQLDNGGAQ